MAARRQAGGVATANLTEMAKRARRRVDLAANIFGRFGVKKRSRKNLEIGRVRLS